MDELTRFASLLAERLAARPGSGSNGGVSVHAIRQEILPYRLERRNLGLSSVEDYELVLLRLTAEERGYGRTLPPAAAERCRDVLAHPNPDLGVLDQLGEAVIQLTSLAPSRRIAEPPSRPAAELPSRPAAQPPSRPAGAEASCPHCSGALPPHRPVTYCPHCGKRVVPLRCERCGSEVESGWRHCVACGAPVRDPYRPS